MSAFGNLAAAMFATFQDAAGGTITYHRGDDAIEDIVAVRGRSTLELNDEQGLIQFSSVDFQIKKTDLVIDDAAITPEQGDYIIDAAGKRYDVFVLPYRPMDNDATLFRIHTKQTT